MNPQLLTQKRVLVIDDEDGVREIIQFSLEATAEWEILTAASGREGIAIAIDKQPDAILLDVMMPEMDGPATFQHLQANPLTQHIPTILLTAKAKISEQKQYQNLGIMGIITKPFQAADLARQVSLILNWQA